MSFEWDKASFNAACRNWKIRGVAAALLELATKAPWPIEWNAGVREIDRVTCFVFDSSQRRVADLLGCSATAVDKALLRLESLGLASRGTSGDGTRFVLCISRLFEAPTRPERIPKIPPESARQPRANQAPTFSPVSVREESIPLRSSFSSVSVQARRAPNFWQRTDLLPYDRGRFTDEDLLTLDVEMLRRLFLESVRTKRLDRTQSEQFLAMAFHCAKSEGLDGRRVATFMGRIKNRNWRGLVDGAWEWSSDQHEQRKRRTPQEGERTPEPAGLGDIVGQLIEGASDA